VIHAYNRILDLKEKHVDIEVLQILVNAACSSDTQGDIKKRAEQLFTRLTQQVSSLFRRRRRHHHHHHHHHFNPLTGALSVF